MGLQKKTTGKFVRIKDGKFYLGKDLENSYDELTGMLTDMSFKNDTFEGQTIRKLVLTLNENGESYIVSFPFDSGYASSFVSFVKNADLSEPITLVPVSKTEGDKTSRSLLVSQDGTFMKSYFTKDNKHGQPDFKKTIKKSGKVEWDKEDFLEFRESVINELRTQLNGSKVAVETEGDEPVFETKPTPKKPSLPQGEDEGEDDLPF